MIQLCTVYLFIELVEAELDFIILKTNYYNVEYIYYQGRLCICSVNT